MVPEGSWSRSISKSYRDGGASPTPFDRLFYSLDFGHSRLFFAFLGLLKAYFSINIFWSRALCASIG